MNKTIKAIELLNMMKNGEIDEVEIIEEQPEIDIQDLEEIKPEIVSGNQYIIDVRTRMINQLIKAIKQLDKRIKKLEE